MNRQELERIATQIVDSAIKVHKALGPGLLESTYQCCLAFELVRRGLKVDFEKPLPVVYEGFRLDAGYRIDLFIEDEIIIENKAVTSLLPVHEAQMLTYLKLSGRRLGFLINWNVPRLRQGLQRMVLGLRA